MKAWIFAIAAAVSLVGRLNAQLQPWPDHPYRPRVDVMNYAFTIAIPDSGSFIRASVELTVRRAPPLDTLILDLRDLRVTSAHVRAPMSLGADVPVRQDSTMVRIPWIPGRDSMIVDLQYEGRVTDGLVARRDSAGRWTYFGDNWPRRARRWLASVDDPSDKATVQWTVLAPNNDVVVANGELQDSTRLADGRIRWRWRESRAIPTYLMVIAVAQMVHVNLLTAACGHAELTQCVSESAWAYPGASRHLGALFSTAPQMVDYFSSLVGPFPYEKLAHLQSTTRFGGMENASAIFYNAREIAAGTLPEGTVAHETAHQWFGDAVTPRAFSHLWLSEGFANYYAARWDREAHGDSAFRENLRAMRRNVAASEVTERRPVVDSLERDEWQLLNSNSYDRGAWVLHMLAVQLGDSTFDRGIRSYYEHYRHGTATTRDLRTEMEIGSHRDLGAFFDQWLYRPGIPRFRVRWQFDRTAKRLLVTVEQPTGSFRFPLVLGIVDSEGTMRRVSVSVAGRTTRATFASARAPRAIVVDPDVTLLYAELP